MSVTQRPQPAPSRAHRTTPAWVWLVQAVTGGLLLVLLTLHMIAQHFVARGGLRTYADVVDWIRNPVVLAIELAFLVTATWHALLGVRGILLDLGLGVRAERLVTRCLIALGAVTVAYGTWLLLTIAHQA